MGIVFVNGLIGFIISIPINMVLGLGAVNMGNKGDPAMAPCRHRDPVPDRLFGGTPGCSPGCCRPRSAAPCLVVVFEYLIVIVICMVIAVPFIILGLVFAGR